MSAFNENENEIKMSIESILKQTYSDFEFIIVLDNPQNKKMLLLLQQYSELDERINVIINDTNIGLAKSLNKAIKISKGEYIARMDADDISVKERLEIEISYLNNHKECDVIASDYINIDAKGKKLPTKHIVINDKKMLKKALLCGNIIVHPSIVLRRTVIESVNGYRNFKSSQDYDLWLRLLKRNVNFYTVPKVLIYYRIRQNGISKMNVARQYSYALYAQDLYKREKINDDFFSEEDLKLTLCKYKLYTNEDQQLFNKAYISYMQEKDKNHLYGCIKALFIHHGLLRFLMNSKAIDKIIKKT